MKKTESHAYPRGGAPPHAHILWLWGRICWWILLLSLTASEAFDYLPDFSRMPLPVPSAHTCGFEPSTTKHIVIYGSLAIAVQREVSARATECRGSYTSVISSTVQTEIEGQERNNFFFFLNLGWRTGVLTLIWVKHLKDTWKKKSICRGCEGQKPG